MLDAVILVVPDLRVVARLIENLLEVAHMPARALTADRARRTNIVVFVIGFGPPIAALGARTVHAARVHPNWPVAGDDNARRIPVRLHQPVKRRGIAGMQPDAAVRGRRTQAPDLVAAVDGVAAVEEDRMRH